MYENAIIVFLRHPTPGRVKTRLAKDVGDQSAAQFYKICAESIIHECTKLHDTKIYIFYSSLDETDAINAWLASYTTNTTIQFDFVPQIQSENLGHRLEHAFEHVISQKIHNRALVIGTDVPDLNTTLLQNTFSSLKSPENEYNIIFGPSIDGGYYLLGLEFTKTTTNCIKDLFSDIEWSTPSVLNKSLQNARKAGLISSPNTIIPINYNNNDGNGSNNDDDRKNNKNGCEAISLLPRLLDIDTIDDLSSWLKDSATREEENSVDDGNIRLLLDAARSILASASINKLQHAM